MNYAILYAIILVEVAIGAAGFVASAVSYFVLAPWHRTRIGRNFMFLLFAVALSLVLALVLQVVSDMEAKLVVATLLYGMFAVSGSAFTAAILSEQIKNRKNNNDKGTP